MRSVISTSLLSLFLAGCSTTPEQSVSSYYDYQLYSPQSKPIQLSSLPDALRTADVILVGEWHSHAGIHRFQTDLLKTLLKQPTTYAVSMEQFSRDKQPVMTEYLAGKIGEQMLIKNGNAWPNYESDYRPIVELAKANDLDVIAANAPKFIVRCIGQQGLGYLNKLTLKERTFIAQDIDTSASPYKEKFMASMHHGAPEQTEKHYAAQITWDETMAESITDYLQDSPENKVLHLAGKFHTEQGLGIKAAILKRNPRLNVAVITPTSLLDNSTDGDFRLKVLAPPVRFVQAENRKQAFQNLSNRNDTLTCR